MRRLLALLFGKIIHYLLELKQYLHSLRPLQVIPVKLAGSAPRLGWSSAEWQFYSLHSSDLTPVFITSVAIVI